MQYRKKPVVIDDIQWDGTKECWLKLVEFVGPALIGRPEFHTVIIKTPEGDMYVSRGDFIMKDGNGEFYPCKPDIFKEIHSLAKELDGNNKIKKTNMHSRTTEIRKINLGKRTRSSNC